MASSLAKRCFSLDGLWLSLVDLWMSRWQTRQPGSPLWKVITSTQRSQDGQDIAVLLPLFWTVGNGLALSSADPEGHDSST